MNSTADSPTPARILGRWVGGRRASRGRAGPPAAPAATRSDPRASRSRLNGQPRENSRSQEPTSERSRRRFFFSFSHRSESSSLRPFGIASQILAVDNPTILFRFVDTSEPGSLSPASEKPGSARLTGSRRLRQDRMTPEEVPPPGFVKFQRLLVPLLVDVDVVD